MQPEPPVPHDECMRRKLSILPLLLIGALAMASCTQSGLTPLPPPPTKGPAPAATPTATATPPLPTQPAAAAMPLPTSTQAATPVEHGPSSSSTPAPRADTSPAPVRDVSTPAPETSVADVCGNAVGNGDQIITGPLAPEPDNGPDNDSVFRSLTVHPTDPNVVLMGTERNGFVRSTDGGVTWTRHRLGLRWFGNETYPEIWDIAYAPSNPSVVYAATLDSPGPVVGDVPSAMGGIYKSRDGGETWSRANCGLSTSRITSIRVHPANPDVVAAGLEGGEASFSHSTVGGYYEGGLFRTVDGGDSWAKVSVGENDGRNGFWRMEARGGTLFTFGFNYYDPSDNLGFLRSDDVGATWAPLTGGQLTPLLITSFDVSSDGQVIYANERDTFFHWVSRDGGSTWSQTAIDQANGPLSVSPADPNMLVFASQNRLLRSTDGLATWTEVAAAPQPPGHMREAPFHDIVFAPSDPNIVYAATEGYLVYKSTDAGATWTLMKNVRADVLNVQP